MLWHFNRKNYPIRNLNVPKENREQGLSVDYKDDKICTFCAQKKENVQSHFRPKNPQYLNVHVKRISGRKLSTFRTDLKSVSIESLIDFLAVSI